MGKRVRSSGILAVEVAAQFHSPEEQRPGARVRG